MWRLGERSLPDGIRVDGGSDWLCLHQSFIRFVCKDKNPLVEGLLEYWSHSLLSAEVCRYLFESGYYTVVNPLHIDDSYGNVHTFI